MARKTREEQQLEDLQRFADESYLQRSDVQRALRAQGVNVPTAPVAPGSDAANPFTGDENGPSSTDANGVTAVNARDTSGTVIPEEDELDALNRATIELQDTTRERRAADRLRARHPDTDQAQQQATADKIQEALGSARRVSETTQGGIRDRVFSAADRLGAVSTPGGIAGLLLVIFLLLFILVEVNGQPRGVWLWLVLLRKAHLMPEDKAAQIGLAGRGESTPSHSETQRTQQQGQRQDIPTVNQQTVSAYGQTAAAGANITPINVASSLLNGAASGLDRYINP